MNKHTAEPWAFGTIAIAAATGGHIAHRPVLVDESASDELWNANARRIVACVNACAGVPIEELEKLAKITRPNIPGAAGVALMAITNVDLRDFNDKLVAALSTADCECTVRERNSGHRVGCWMPDYQFALRKLTQP